MRQIFALVLLCCCLLGSRPASAQQPPSKDDQAAWQLFAEGVQKLEEGKPRAEVLQPWESALQQFPHGRYAAQLTDYVAQLRTQLNDEKALADSTVAEPDTMPLKERIDYYIARFPDVHGVQWSQPGRCSTLSGKDRNDTVATSAIVKIGRPAIPALIARLE